MAGNAFPLGGNAQATGAITGMLLRRRRRTGEVYEWCLKEWGLDPEAIRSRFDPEQLTMLWDAGMRAAGARRRASISPSCSSPPAMPRWTCW